VFIFTLYVGAYLHADEINKPLAGSLNEVIHVWGRYRKLHVNLL
jgi:hypothetical protein